VRLARTIAQCAMSPQESLSAIEALIEKVSAAVLAADPQTLERSTVALRDAAAQFARVFDDSGARGVDVSPDLQERMESIGRMLAVHRESLARMSASTDRQVEGLLPQAGEPATYGDGLGVRGSHPGIARIYRSTS
jgi:hypothetical protein